jgi:ferric-dicitrate binding protein FerR (iron transport regulator)
MNKNFSHIDDQLLLRFLLGEANEDEMHQVQEWLQLSEENQSVLDSYENLWAETGKLTPKPVAVDTPMVWKKMSNRIDLYEEDKKSVKTISLKSRLTLFSSSIAAAIIIMFGVYQLLLKQPQQILIASTEEVLHDTLPDGTNIALNKNSNITYPEQFTKNERRVKLEGEAFFKVEHDKEKPFIIETGDAYIQVLGTSFNVKAYENNELEVIVTEGLVKIYTVDSETMDTSAILLKAGQKGRIRGNEQKPIYVSDNIPDAIFWMNYTLIFNDTDLKKVFNLIENYYNVEIKVNNDKIYDCRLSTTFTNNSINDIIEVIAATFEFEFTKENNTYTIKGDGCAAKKN